MTLETSAFRALMSSFPTGVVVVTTLDADGSPKGLTTQSFISVSSEPRLVLVSVDRTSRTLPALRASAAFVVNFLAAGRVELSNLFASKSDDKFARVAWEPSALAKGSPILREDSIAYAECVVVREIEAGDHSLLLASVEGGALIGGTPLMYYRRTYASWSEGDKAS